MTEPLTIEWGTFETLSTLGGLAHCLLDHWHVKGRGDAYVTAITVCDVVLPGSEDDQPADARAALVKAAHKAGISVFPDDDFG